MQSIHLIRSYDAIFLYLLKWPLNMKKYRIIAAYYEIFTAQWPHNFDFLTAQWPHNLLIQLSAVPHNLGQKNRTKSGPLYVARVGRFSGDP